ncbi:ubiquitin carboxyl-terminal hydrolase [Anaeramoeba flamelloides]|uniref:Ubiquitin carboxyl-terminal hydrolase n=1 Tax=Anaeramoeba flamelloides TaxID=1746091 RepID=A0AAV7Z098_9EUKA|nr:ubiquitin carboxyl-terminal hydrolase [Anaeramoeba flamelloides]
MFCSHETYLREKYFIILSECKDNMYFSFENEKRKIIFEAKITEGTQIFQIRSPPGLKIVFQSQNKHNQSYEISCKEDDQQTIKNEITRHQKKLRELKTQTIQPDKQTFSTKNNQKKRELITYQRKRTGNKNNNDVQYKKRRTNKKQGITENNYKRSQGSLGSVNGKNFILSYLKKRPFANNKLRNDQILRSARKNIKKEKKKLKEMGDNKENGLVQTKISNFFNFSNLSKNSYFSTNRRKFIGMKNLGNTCYMNAILEVLIHLKIFIKDLSIIKYKNSNLGRNTFYQSLLQIYKESNSKNKKKYIDLTNLRKIMRITNYFQKFQNSNQQDALEFLENTLNTLQYELFRLYKKPKSLTNSKFNIKQNNNQKNNLKMNITAKNFNQNKENNINKNNMYEKKKKNENEKKNEKENQKEKQNKKENDNHNENNDCKYKKSQGTADEPVLFTFDELQKFCPISKNFDFVIKITYKCLSCSKKSKKYEIFRSISLNIPIQKQQKTNGILTNFSKKDIQYNYLTTLLDSFFKKDEIIEKRCEFCSGLSSFKEMKIVKLPTIFLIHIQRIAIQENQQNGKTFFSFYKQNSPVLFENVIDLKKYCNSKVINPNKISERTNISNKTNLVSSIHNLQNNNFDEQLKLAMQMSLYEYKKESEMNDKLSLKEKNNDDQKLINKTELNQTITIDDNEEDMNSPPTSTTSTTNTTNSTPGITGIAATTASTNIASSSLSSEKEPFIIKLNEKIFQEKTIEKQIASQYQLSSVVLHLNHSQSTQSGHYVSSIFDFQNKEWRYFNDSQVKTINTKEVFSFKHQKSCYLLFYINKKILNQKNSYL